MEMLVRVVDRSDAVDDEKRGDVIVVCPDGWAWSDIELNDPRWRIIKAPILGTHADTLVSAPRTMGVMKKRPQKAYMIDPSKLPDPTVFDTPRTGHIVLGRAHVEAATVKKA